MTLDDQFNIDYDRVAKLYNQGYGAKAIAVMLRMHIDSVEQFICLIDETNYHLDMAEGLDVV